MGNSFQTRDGRQLSLVHGFREQVLQARPSGTPQSFWTAADYARVAAKRVGATRQRIAQTRAALGRDDHVSVLDVGCGSALDSAIAALDGLGDVIAVDRDPALLDDGDRGERGARFVEAALAAAGAPDRPLASLPMRIDVMDASALDLPTASVDVVWSRTALEHFHPLDEALSELARVTRPGGVAHHIIDPFFWVKGCHASGVTDLPWAHARLEAADYARAVEAAEGPRRAARRTAFLATLNHLGVDAWRSVVLADDAWTLVSWSQTTSPLAERLLAQYPDVTTTLLPGVQQVDLTCSTITVVLRRSQ